LLPAGRPRRFVRMQIFSVHPLRDEAIVLMPDKNLRSLTALSVLFGQFYCSAERLCFAWESCCDMAMSDADLPSPFWFITTYRDFGNASSNCGLARPTEGNARVRPRFDRYGT
jgi:hypothetical protein